MEDIKLGDNERLDDLEIDDMHIIQNTRLYTFTSDAVVLANSVRPTSRDNILDIGTGSGILPLIVAAKNNVHHIDAVEIQSVMADLARRNVEMNGLDSKISIINSDIKEYKTTSPYDIIMTNPPYFDAGDTRDTLEVAMSRHEIAINLRELIENASRLLKFGGKFYMVHKVTRLAEAIAIMTENGIVPKVLTLIYPKDNIEADTFIIEGKSHAKHGLRVKKLVMYNSDGSMTDEARIMYNKEIR